MWGNWKDLRKQLSENASKIATSTAWEQHINKAKTSVAGGLDAIANNILTVEPAPAYSGQGQQGSPLQHSPQEAVDGLGSPGSGAGAVGVDVHCSNGWEGEDEQEEAAAAEDEGWDASGGFGWDAADGAWEQA
eukprot:CAMPEP_0177608442 /NCGR_PEP_ID=MMETSP0419_2-20121207/18475_1 /TAXON_ID=582737 /ORGANISM="Tetraselmis sp., Strain GSL018" /LENGTH=132 /DNA_ID=CAMNT_0019103135 /DNA_START=215 /DNA_END=609 /DNA_ORIENTATION=-